jgi:hypothetical protein
LVRLMIHGRHPCGNSSRSAFVENRATALAGTSGDDVVAQPANIASTGTKKRATGKRMGARS